MSWDIHDPDDPETITGVLNKFFSSQKEGAEFAQTLGNEFTLQDGYGFRWILIDKAAIISALNSQASFSNSCNMQFVSPRQPKAIPAWPNNDGNPDGPTYNKHLGDEKRFEASVGDFSGANGLIDFFNGLAAYAAKLRAAGRTRDAGIVQYAYDRIADHTFTISEAAQYLFDNGL